MDADVSDQKLRGGGGGALERCPPEGEGISGSKGQAEEFLKSGSLASGSASFYLIPWMFLMA